MASRKTTSKPKNNDTLIGAVKDVAIRTLSTGYFYQLLIALVLLGFAYHIDSKDWVEIFKVATKETWICVLGWMLLMMCVALSAVLFNMQRSTYTREIQRVVDERNRLQDELAGRSLQSSAKPALLEHNGEKAKK